MVGTSANSLLVSGYQPIVAIVAALLFAYSSGDVFSPSTGNDQTQETTETTVVWDGPTLAAIKAGLTQGSIDPSRLDTLVSIAEDMLATPSASVMDKTLLPASGDKHDYHTRAPYFWPNPDTPDGLPYVKRDGELFEENRSGTDHPSRRVMDSKIQTLALAYYLTDEERYAEGAADQLQRWFLDSETAMNPHMKYSQAVPGIMNGSEWGSIDNWNWPTLLDAVRLIRPSVHWSDADDAALKDWFAAYRDWLESSPLGERYDLMWNNHATFFDAQRAAIALFLEQPDRARKILSESWHRRIDHGIEGDGRQRYELERTRSFAYSNFNLRAYMTLAAIGDDVGVDLWNHLGKDGSGIRTAIDFLSPYADSTAIWPFLDIKFDRSAIMTTMHWATIAYGDSSYRERLLGLPNYHLLRGARRAHSADLLYLFLDL
ncbi:MAG: alginate lyase family protein [Rhodothermales bacterium]|nr:alginate lyase family protein [Rhodothermales bacterium]